MSLKSFSVFTSFKAKDGVSPVIQNMNSKTAVFGNKLNKLKAQAQGVGGNIQKSFGGTKKAVGGFVAAVTTGAVVTTLNSWVDKASDLEETLGKTNETFKADSNAVIEWSKTSIKSMGLAQQTALDTAALYGDMGSGMGMTTKRAAEMATSLTQLSADIASFKNVDQKLSANALKGIFTGETEALKNLGVVMNETNLQEYAKKIGVGGKLKNMTQAQKIELRYKYVMDSTKNAQGDFLRTGGNYANQSRMFEEQKKQLETNLGAIMLPKYNEVMKSLNSILLKYAPVIEKGFGSLFKNFEEGLKICSPLFDKFKNLFKTFSTTIFPTFQRSIPIIKTLLSTVVVPALGLVIDSINVLLKVTTSVYRFVKDNFLSIVLSCLGPVGFIISSLLKLPSIIKQLKSGGGIKIEGADGKDIKEKKPKVKGNRNGSIEVKTTIDNRTGYNAQTSTSLQSPNNLSLKPA